MRAVVVGAGIGGLAVAVALHKIGIESSIIERAPSIREAGAGLTLWSNAVNALRELGVESRVMESASVIEKNVVRNPAGRLLTVNEFGNIARVAGAPSICVHRAVLQRILLEELPAGRVRTGSNCVAFDGSAAVLEDGERIEADFLIGADGVFSTIRVGLHGARPPRFAGYTCWRGILGGRFALPERSGLFVASAGKQFGALPCGSGQVYWFLTHNAPPGGRATKREIIQLCQHWAFPVPEILESTPEEAILQNDVIDRPPLTHWGRGCVTLLGDAAHPTTPNLGQGACMALEDAVILASCIRTISQPRSALRQYESLRIGRTNAIVRQSLITGRILQLDRPASEFIRNWFTETPLGRGMGNRMFRNLLTYKIPKLSALPSEVRSSTGERLS